ncbi:helix-turn-helix domain-containing protein [Streptococcus dysgalactiae]|uniref:XRE family transcriptional regulator n=1 Tax=Streptococcus dysgalactiae subsp. dysgalactiae TaxID=99822 RepID=A0A9X7S268_STRDY|nr:helix-turn-helix transcriptional regulator [Streptococcus dysgalactiae]MSU87382.1 XRE family transcriptional regulator [Streptococcus dysgalactiae subsp. dysgalactiae]QGG98002.1 XRE family transcriptional regulator [Streptococcus dysgalactiae subsp. dysgalactiae]QGH02964.1 XRE family transcriptional regulator [Streptococcus dysgalactiae subsp. dysgalactiae]
MTKVAEQLKQLRVKHQLSQDALAEQLFISRQAISKWENGDTTPDLDNLVRLTEIFGVSLDELVLAKPNEVKVERIYENKPLDFQKYNKLYWFIFRNIILSLLIILVILTILEVLGVPFVSNWLI